MSLKEIWSAMEVTVNKGSRVTSIADQISFSLEVTVNKGSRVTSIADQISLRLIGGYCDFFKTHWRLL
jgi:hypothetical protein